jgi:outer membrane protein OmpA-like peptidoglycan-associated protein
MKWLAIVISVVAASCAYSQVKVDSYYFEKGNGTFASSSQTMLDSFVYKLENKVIQVIEINAFVDDKKTKGAKKISQARIDTFVNRFGLYAEDITINNFATIREQVAFKVENWDRIDVYYYQGDKSFVDEVEIDLITDSERDAKVEFGVPLVLPIKFKGGTNKVLPESMIYLEELADTLVSNSFLTVHIRGHVCCGDNMRISEKRAKAVYNHLKKRGVAEHRLSFKGYSNTLPIIFPERTQADRSKNRRVDVIFNNSGGFQS